MPPSTLASLLLAAQTTAAPAPALDIATARASLNGAWEGTLDYRDYSADRWFGIPVKTVYSGELCPDHCNVMVLGDALVWAEEAGSDCLLVETAGLCLRCSPYIEGSLGVVVLEATSGMNLPRKIGPMLSLADVAVVTKVDLISQAEREVFRARILENAREIRILEADALYGIGLDPLPRMIEESKPLQHPLYLRGNPPVGTCTVCVGKKEIGWKQHFGIVRSLESEAFYRGE